MKQVGDVIKEGDVLCEVETDKATAEVPSIIDGTLKEILVQEGETVPVGQKIAVVE